MISQRSFNLFSYFVLIVMIVSLVLLFTRTISQDLAWTVFAIILVLYLLRIALRLLIARQQRNAAAAKGAEPEAPPPPAS